MPLAEPHPGTPRQMQLMRTKLSLLGTSQLLLQTASVRGMVTLKAFLSKALITRFFSGHAAKGAGGQEVVSNLVY